MVTQNEILYPKLITVCWFDVSTPYVDLVKGTYVLEINGVFRDCNFDVSLDVFDEEGVNEVLHVENVVIKNFPQYCDVEMGRFVLGRNEKIYAKIYNHNGSWKHGFLLAGMKFRRIPDDFCGMLKGEKKIVVEKSETKLRKKKKNTDRSVTNSL